MARVSRFLSVALVLLVLTSPALLASGGRAPHPAPTSMVSLASRLWVGLSRLVGLSSTTPDGRRPVLPTGDNGSTMDPDGKK